MKHYHFEIGKPACPVGCKYCHVTELDADRSATWAKVLVGINKACTFLAIPPWISDDKETRDRFYSFPWDLLKGDFVGWTAITDGFMPEMRPYFWHWIEQVTTIAKATTVVTKWSINREMMKELAEVKNFFLVVSITGAETIEKIPTKVHLRTLELAKEYGVKALPIVHPYISGVSDLSFLPSLRNMGYQEISVKGLRYNPTTMGNWMPEKSKHLYPIPGQEILPEDGWRDKIFASGLNLLSPKEWYFRDAWKNPPNLQREDAIANVDHLLSIAQIASSATVQEVREAAIARRVGIDDTHFPCLIEPLSALEVRRIGQVSN